MRLILETKALKMSPVSCFLIDNIVDVVCYHALC